MQRENQKGVSLDGSPGVDLQPVGDVCGVVGVGGDQEGLAPLRRLRLVTHRGRLVVAGDAAKGHREQEVTWYRQININTEINPREGRWRNRMGVLPQQATPRANFCCCFWASLPITSHW